MTLHEESQAFWRLRARLWGNLARLALLHSRLRLSFVLLLSLIFWGSLYGLFFEGFQFLPREELGLLIDVLIAAAEFWAGQGKPFYAVFIDPERMLMLADLQRDA